jgi:mannan endo-1,4-beta-mannosidase
MGGNLRSSIFYTSSTNFDVSRAVIPGTAEYTATVRDIDAIAV